jgi:ABC-type uncharacterized transport system substrate-binding protein
MWKIPIWTGARGSSRCVTRRFSPRHLPSILGIVLCVSFVSSAVAEPKARNVLVVFSASEHDPRFLTSIESAIRARVPGEVNFLTAFVDYQRSEDESYRESLAETFRREFRETRPDVVIAGSIQALEFMMEYRDRMFPGVPIVFTGVAASELDGTKLAPGVTGVESSVGLRETIDLALRLHPDTKAVAVIEAGHDFWWTIAHSELLRHQAGLERSTSSGHQVQGCFRAGLHFLLTP